MSSRKKKLALVTWFGSYVTGSNYGTSLQSFALLRKLSDLGYEVCIVPEREASDWKTLRVRPEYFLHLIATCSPFGLAKQAIQKIGDGRGSHTQGYNYDAAWYAQGHNISMQEDVVHPISVEMDSRAVVKTEQRMCGIVPRGLTFIGNKMPAFQRIITLSGKVAEMVCPILFRV